MRFQTALRIFPKLWGTNGYLHTAGYVFVIGHMRSYSSLLAHIVGSHPRVIGYAEMHQAYRSPLDLLQLVEKVERTCEKKAAGSHVLDKILHPQPLHRTVLRKSNVKVILLARAPRPALSSILRIRAGGISSVEQAIDYYVSRLTALTQIAHQRDGDVLYLDSELILEDTERVLGGLSAYLQLSPGLRGEYSIFRYTGVPKYGDPSELIRAGKVVRRRAENPPFALSNEQHRRLRMAYESLQLCMRNTARVTLLRARRDAAEGLRVPIAGDGHPTRADPSFPTLAAGEAQKAG